MSGRTDRVLVAGASGGTGRELLRLLRESDYGVVALTSSPSKVTTLEVMGADDVVVGEGGLRSLARSHVLTSLDS